MNQLEVMPGLIITNQLSAMVDDTLVVSDLHIGYESVLEDSGLHLPHIQTETMRDSLMDIVDRHSPDRFLLLRDLKHEFSRNLAQEWSEARRILGTLQDHGEVIFVRGNHVNYLATIASKLGVELVDDYSASGIHFRSRGEGRVRRLPRDRRSCRRAHPPASASGERGPPAPGG